MPPIVPQESDELLTRILQIAIFLGSSCQLSCVDTLADGDVEGMMDGTSTIDALLETLGDSSEDATSSLDGALQDATDAISVADSTGQALDAELDAEDRPDVASAPLCPPPDLDCDGIAIHDRNAPHRNPIVLVHGMGGFENLGPLEYYYGIPELLGRNGYQVHITITDPFNSSEVRAQQLAPQIDQILACACKDKVNLIAHSQGGIDARLLISGMGYADRVSSLTTISSPHRGTRTADAILGLTNAPTQGLVDMFLAAFSGVVYGPPDEDPDVHAAMTSCSTVAMRNFNERYPNAEEVAYYSYAGFSGLLADGRPECEGSELAIPRQGDVIAPEFAVGFAFLGGILVANDGLVTVESAKWGRFRGCVPADHLDEIGQIGGIVDRFDYRRFYLELAEFIGDEGF